MAHECCRQALALAQNVPVVERIGECEVDPKRLVQTEVVRERYREAVLQCLQH